MVQKDKTGSTSHGHSTPPHHHPLSAHLHNSKYCQLRLKWRAGKLEEKEGQGEKKNWEREIGKRFDD